MFKQVITQDNDLPLIKIVKLTYTELLLCGYMLIVINRKIRDHNFAFYILHYPFAIQFPEGIEYMLLSHAGT